MTGELFPSGSRAVAPPLSKPELRKIIASDLAGIIKVYPAPDCDEISPPIEVVSDTRYDHKYGALAEELFVEFNKAAVSTNKKHLRLLAGGGNILNGFYVITKALSYAPPAYVKYLKTNDDKPGSVDELSDILRASHSTLKVISHLDTQSNHTFEVNFGLREFSPVYEETPFVIEPSDGKVLFLPSPTTLCHSRIEVARRKLEGDMSMNPTISGYCPAEGKVMTTLWRDAISICSTRPELFQADLETALAA